MPQGLRKPDVNSVGDKLVLVEGKPFSVGTGFEALSFRHAMFSGSMDPLIMVDHFTMTAPTFGPHAHAGLSAVSILFEDSQGTFRNTDSLGNDIDLMPGDLYWLKAGRGAVHDEKPRHGARTHALQVFVNLPARMKYDEPESLHVKTSDMPQIVGKGFRARLMLGQSGGYIGANSPALPMTILDVHLDAEASFEHQIPLGQTAWILNISGSVTIQSDEAPLNLEPGSSIAMFSDENRQHPVIFASSSAHFVILQAEPVREQFVQRGPFAMSTDKEVESMFAAHAAGQLGAIDET